MKLSKIARAMISVIAVCLLIIVVAGAVFYRSFAVFPFALGAFLGAGVNAVKLIMLERAVTRATQMDEKDAGRYVQLQYLIRFTLTGMVLVFAALAPFVNLWGAVAGIFTLPVSAFSMKFFKGLDEDEDKTA